MRQEKRWRTWGLRSGVFILRSDLSSSVHRAHPPPAPPRVHGETLPWMETRCTAAQSPEPQMPRKVLSLK